MDRGTRLTKWYFSEVFLWQSNDQRWGPREVLWIRLGSDDLESDNEYIQLSFGGNEQKKKEKEEKTVCRWGAVTKSKLSGLILYCSWKSQTPKGGGTLFLGGDVPLGPWDP